MSKDNTDPDIFKAETLEPNDTDRNADSNTDNHTAKPKRRRKKTANKPDVKEALLEFIQQDDGALVLKEVGNDEALVSIDFSDKLKEMLGKETMQIIAHHMIQAGVASFMQHQMNQWHAYVHEETPEHFS